MRKMPFYQVPFLLILGLMTFVSSCSSSRFYKEMAYSPREQAPDISGGEKLPVENPSGNKTNLPVAGAQSELIEPEITVNKNYDVAENNSKMKHVVDAFKKEMIIEQDTQEKSTNRELMKKVSNRLVQEGQISNLSAREGKKLDRMAAKMDKKLKKQGNEIDWRNNTPLELFFMIMAIAGLVLGIVSVSFGWFVFIVFAGIWLYFKLVVDNK